jgi:hypothetical protein
MPACHAVWWPTQDTPVADLTGCWHGPISPSSGPQGASRQSHRPDRPPERDEGFSSYSLFRGAPWSEHASDSARG